ncbi:MAG: ABC transporter permease [Anaerolineales bacterium]|nr:ABC transporter permease [Anaerolineales bacterium]
MKKILSICWKDLILVLNDRAALIFMLLAPFLLTLGMGLVTGSFSSNRQTDTGIEEIPVILVNLDSNDGQESGQMGQVIVDVFLSEDMATLFDPTVMDDQAAARRDVENGQAAAAVFIPAGFTESIFPEGASQAFDQSAPQVEVYANPGAPISASIVQSLVVQVVSQIETARVSGAMTIYQLVASGRLSMDEIEAFVPQMAERLAASQEGASATGALIRLEPMGEEGGEEDEDVNYMAYIAPGMSALFLMYTVTQGSRSILAERDMGTLPRMLCTPTTSLQVLGGKLLAIFVTGLLQMLILVIASALLFRLDWGNPLLVLLLLVAVVAAATGWGILLASVAKTRGQISSIGTAMMLLFGILGGSFFPPEMMTGLIRLVGRLTPNAYAVDGFALLAGKATLADMLPIYLSLIGLAVALFILSVLLARKRWASGFLK